MRNFFRRKMITLSIAASLVLGTIGLPPWQGVAHAAAQGTVYYIDSVGGNDANSGQSESQAWKTLSKVNNKTFQPGDKILFKAGGVWNGQLWPKGSGTDGSPIVIDQYGAGSKPAIHGGGNNFTNTIYNSTTTYNTGTVLLKNQEYWEINNLEVTNDDDFTVENNDPNALRAGIFFVIDSNQSDRVFNHIYIRDCYIHDIDGYNNAGSKENGGIFGVIKGTSATSQATVARFNDVRIENNTIRKVDRVAIRVAAHANYVNDDSFSTTATRKYGNWNTNFYVGNNTMEDVGGDGIILRDTDGAVVEHNVLNKFGTRVAGSNAIAGIWLAVAKNTTLQYNEVSGGPAYNQDGCAFDFDEYLTNTVYQYNYSHDNPMGQMLLMGTNENDVMRYNVSQNDGAAFRHFAFDEKTPAYIYNNVFYYDGAKFKVSLDETKNGYNLSNNIFYNMNPSVATDWGTFNWGQVAFSNNLFYEAGGVHSAAEPKDPRKVTANPGFVNPGGAGIGLATAYAYELKADSPAIDAGLAMAGNGGKDYEGNPLYNVLPDIGAFEYQGDTSQVNHQPLAQDARYSVTEGSQVSGTLGATDPDGDPLQYSIVNGPASGTVQLTNSSTGEFVYTANFGVWGSDSFTFKVSDGKLDSAAGTVTIDISPANLVRIGAAEDAFVRDGTYAKTNYGAGATLDVKADATSYARQAYIKFDMSSFGGSVANAKVTLVPTSVAKVGVTNEAHPVSDNSWKESTLTWNNKPSAGAMFASWSVPAAGTPVKFDVTNQAKAALAAGKILSLQIITSQADYGSNSLVSYASKENATASYRPVIEIQPVITKPVAAGSELTTPQDTVVSGTLSASDANGAPLTYSIVINGAKGTAAITNAATGAFTYTPIPGATGPDTFTFKASNGYADSDAATVTVHIRDTIPPVTADDAKSEWQNAAQTVHLAATDAGSGVAHTYYSLDGSPFAEGTAVTVSSEGAHEFKYYSVDNEGNEETAKSAAVKIDMTGPSITPTVTMAVYQTDAATIAFDVQDGLSGVAGMSFELDGKSVPYPIMLEPLKLSVGPHSIRANASDRAGNVTTRDFTLNVMMDIGHLPQLLQSGAGKGWISDSGVLNSLMAKANHLGQKQGGIRNGLNALENEVQAQAGKHIQASFANVLLSDIAYLKQLYLE
ncbi:CBM96 family carbohydrate-binding protein [Gordoniibacillus kamchatkensis]|uniref:CBM96 family carbohydrate-binding protein n=1 Tax=Gordoniibacillus kamchatkensis TaxID=1590651 RepID=UPI0006972B8A|nr:DNRLRE domain-containing protein [Paenibacillus sp. VKM B-2647]